LRICFWCQDVPQPARSPAGHLALYQDRRMRGMYVDIYVRFRVEGLKRLPCSLSRPADAWYVCVCVCVIYHTHTHTHTHTHRKPVHIAHSRAAGRRTQAQILKSPFSSKVLSGFKRKISKDLFWSIQCSQKVLYVVILCSKCKNGSIQWLYVVNIVGLWLLEICVFLKSPLLVYTVFSKRNIVGLWLLNICVRHYFANIVGHWLERICVRHCIANIVGHWLERIFVFEVLKSQLSSAFI